MKSKLCIAALTVVLITGVGTIQAQQPSIAKDYAYHQRITKLKQQIQSNPDSLKFHKELIDSLRRNTVALDEQYTRWIKEFPKSAIIPYAIGSYYERIESSEAKHYLLIAIEKNPKLSEAWYLLSRDAERWGLLTESKEYVQKAIDIAPKNVNYRLAQFSCEKDLQKFIDLGLKIVDDFPQSESSALALYWIGEKTKDIKNKVKYLGLLVKTFSPSKFQVSNIAVKPYFDALLLDNLKNAIAQAKIMSRTGELQETWTNYVKQAQTIALADSLIKVNKGSEALVALLDVRLGQYMGFNKVLESMKANAYSLQGKHNAAYLSLINAFLEHPSKEINNLIYQYGQKLNKDEDKIKIDIWNKVDSIARPATQFSLKKTLGVDTVSLADYKGKVVLLTYWYPGCGPCREEFPHFENVIKKLNHKDIAYLAINIVPAQNAYVSPFLKKTGYSFLSLDDPRRVKRDKGNLDNRGFAPVNFLIDKEGRLVFSQFTINQKNEDELELMIKILLEGTAE